MQDKLSIDEQHVDLVVDGFFKTVKSKMENPTMPGVHFQAFGKFSPKLGAVNRWIRVNFTSYRKGLIDRDTLSDRISKVWPVRQRLILEKIGVSTFRNWKQYHDASSKEQTVVYVKNQYTTEDFFNKDKDYTPKSRDRIKPNKK